MLSPAFKGKILSEPLTALLFRPQKKKQISLFIFSAVTTWDWCREEYVLITVTGNYTAINEYHTYRPPSLHNIFYNCWLHNLLSWTILKAILEGEHQSCQSWSVCRLVWLCPSQAGRCNPLSMQWVDMCCDFNVNTCVDMYWHFLCLLFCILDDRDISFWGSIYSASKSGMVTKYTNYLL